MQFSLETIQGLKRRLSISVDTKDIRNEFKKSILSIARREQIPGFRPGKVPISLIEKRYGSAVETEVTEKAMQRHFYEAVLQEKLSPAGVPELKVSGTEANQFQFTAIFEVLPEIQLIDFTTLNIDVLVSDVTEADVDNMIERLRKNQAQWEESDKVLDEGDRATFDFLGEVGGEPFEDLKAEDYTLELGASQMIPDFEEGLKGHKAGESLEIEVTFPEDYHAEKLKGKLTVFKVHLIKVEKAELPEVNTKFIKNFGIETGKLADLKAGLRKNMGFELKRRLESETKVAVINKLLDSHQISLPRVLVDREIDLLCRQANQRSGDSEETKNNTSQPPTRLLEEAERRVKIGLLLGEVVKVNALKADHEKIQEKISDIAANYKTLEEITKYYSRSKDFQENVANLVLEEQAIALILGKASVTEREVGFNEIFHK